MSTPVENSPRQPPYRLAGLVMLVVVAVALTLLSLQFRGKFADRTQLTLMADRAGLVMDQGSKVTYNGVEIGKVTSVDAATVDGIPMARVTLEVDPDYVDDIPANVDAKISATTVFGNKYVSLLSPEVPDDKRVSSSEPIPVSSVSTEFNTLFETILEIAEQVDPIKLNQTLEATAQALDGLGDGFGSSLENGNQILADLNPKMPQIRYDTQRLADLADIYEASSADLFNALENAVVTAGTLDQQQVNLDAALMSSIGIDDTGTDVFERGGPYLVRGAEDLIPTSRVLDEYSPMIFCTTRNYANVAPKVKEILGGENGYSLQSSGTVVGAGNPYVYPDNLPRVNARGGPEGKPGCWQNITHELWPAPYLITDTGYSAAPYNHFELGQPMFIDYVWGRQIGENTINP